MRFQFDEEGRCLEGEYSWEEAIEVRVNELREMVAEGAELEIDHDEENGKMVYGELLRGLQPCR